MSTKTTRNQLVKIVKSYEELRGGNEIRVWRGRRQEDGKAGWIIQRFGSHEQKLIGANLTDAYSTMVEMVSEHS